MGAGALCSADVDGMTRTITNKAHLSQLNICRLSSSLSARLDRGLPGGCAAAGASCCPCMPPAPLLCTRRDFCPSAGWSAADRGRMLSAADPGRVWSRAAKTAMVAGPGRDTDGTAVLPGPDCLCAPACTVPERSVTEVEWQHSSAQLRQIGGVLLQPAHGRPGLRQNTG